PAIASLTGVLTGDTYVDVQYAEATGVTLSGINGNEVTFSGSGANGVTVDSGNAPTNLGNGLYRYYLTGAFAAGTVRVQIVAGSWGDTEGDQGVGSTYSFRTIDQVQQQSGTEQRDFFIELSGGMALNSGGLFGDTIQDPLLGITGDVKLTINTTDGLHLELKANGTMTIYKIGNIASGAADFVLDVGAGLSNVTFYGVAAFATNFDFLQQYGIYLQGSALLEVNLTTQTQTPSISLAGIPGDAIFTIDSSLIGQLPTDTFDPVALSSGLISALETGSAPGQPLQLDNGR